MSTHEHNTLRRWDNTGQEYRVIYCTCGWQSKWLHISKYEEVQNAFLDHLYHRFNGFPRGE